MSQKPCELPSPGRPFPVTKKVRTQRYTLVKPPLQLSLPYNIYEKQKNIPGTYLQQQPNIHVPQAPNEPTPRRQKHTLYSRSLQTSTRPRCALLLAEAATRHRAPRAPKRHPSREKHIIRARDTVTNDSSACDRVGDTHLSGMVSTRPPAPNQRGGEGGEGRCARRKNTALGVRAKRGDPPKTKKLEPTLFQPLTRLFRS